MRHRDSTAEGAFTRGAERESASCGAGADTSRGADIFCQATGRDAGGKSGARVFGRSRAGQRYYGAIWNWLCAEWWRFVAPALSRQTPRKNFGGVRADLTGPGRAAVRPVSTADYVSDCERERENRGVWGAGARRRPAKIFELVGDAGLFEEQCAVSPGPREGFA